ncbi:thiamine phosphate synthase [Amphiplicatus metriothermophilus]|uniref:Thiamine-phosphate synthase n=1 Tax=Amphiplicatus metriothermophilus TaxID=1519374 RepID=A0A239Q0A6_9PROT|nr:thiamine phosphate synthase [Amphiplicatus metriothermophilus]MBB5518165.1 thiamine-phosphate pyrophosphorylase [Amphiplicatus metriothermophilus]SNT75327.1 thiamine-phosphate diphosphorylase [Amphiplicatus metriothermophilus]
MSCRLYLVTPPRIADLARFAADFEAALDAGDVACAQLRLKDRDGTPAPDEEILRAAAALLPLARARETAFLVNDRPDLAKKAGADGVHVGQQDAACRDARALLGPDAIIGVTCHDSKHLAMIAGEEGADYVAFGAFFPTDTKEAPTRADPALIEWWAYATTLPCVAIGGITPENCGVLARAGADYLAVCGAVWNDPDGPAAAVRRFEAAIRAAQEAPPAGISG